MSFDPYFDLIEVTTRGIETTIFIEDPAKHAGCLQGPTTPLPIIVSHQERQVLKERQLDLKTLYIHSTATTSR
jgi:hypothetical protein